MNKHILGNETEHSEMETVYSEMVKHIQKGKQYIQK